MVAMEMRDKQAAAQSLGFAMGRLAERGIFPVAANPQEALDLFCLAQALGGPVEDGRHLARVVRSLSAALAAALKRRAPGA
jgi:hypothetical protein